MSKFRSMMRVVALLAVGITVMGGCSGGSSESSAVESMSSSQEEPGSEPASQETAPSRPNTPKIEEYDDSYKETMLQFKKPEAGTPIAVMQTSLGEIRIALYPQVAPKAVENFTTHAKEGYYDGMIFHRVINDFMIQSGDPTGTGTGGESIFKDEKGNPTVFEDEFSDELWNVRGALSMANPGVPNYNQSQFFIVQCPKITYPQEYLDQAGYGPEEADQFVADILATNGFPKNVVSAYVKEGGTPHLDRLHTVFGMVIEGMDVVDKIASVETADADKPVVDVIIEKVTIEEAAG